MQCFCQDLADKNSVKFASDKKFNVNVRVKDENGEIKIENQEIEVCQAYFEDKKMSMILGTSISFIIIIVNTILKMVIINLITWIGEDTVSEQLSSITNGVFYA